MNITLSHGQFVLDGQPFFIYSGEIHYFRIAPEKWKLHLQKAKSAGLNTVSSYIPWIWHEYEEGKFDFSGRSHPQRDLIKFLRLVKEMNLFFVARIGPISNAELINEGLPKWLLKKHPEIYASGRGIINLPHVTIISYLHPVFQSYIEKWYQQVLPIIKKNQISQGGKIILLQLCNEIGMVQWVNKCADFNPYTDKLYRQFLKDKYKNIEVLNLSWKTSYPGFEDIAQPQAETDLENFLMFFDWALFYRNYYACYYATLAKRVNEAGINLPLMANIPQFYDFDVRGRGIYSPMTTSFYRNFPDYVGKVVMGGAYQMRRLDYDNFHDIPITTEAVRMTSDPDVPVFCAELQFGIMRDRPRIYPQDIELNLKTSLAHGLGGLNGYMFSGGSNTSEIGAFGSYHEWQAPVSSEGKEREHYRPVKEFGQLIKTYGRYLAQTKKVTDTAGGFYLPYYATEYLRGKWVEILESKRNNLFFDGLARLLQLAGLNFSLVDIQRAPLAKLLESPHLWIFSLEFMDRSTQEKLVNYVRAGGKLILNPGLPVKDLKGENETYLLDEFSFGDLEKIPEPTVRINNGEIKECYVSGDVSVFQCPGAQILAKSSTGKPAAVIKKLGKGSLMFLGFGLSHIYDYQVDLVKFWAAKLGLLPKISVQPEDVQAVLRTGKEFGFLFLFNYHDVPKEVKVSTVYKLPSRGKMILEPRRGYWLPINLKIEESDLILNYTTVEILSIQKKAKELILFLRDITLPTRAEISLSCIRPLKKVTINGRPIKFNRQGQNFLMEFTALPGMKEMKIS